VIAGAALWLRRQFNSMVAQLSVVGCPMIGDLTGKVAELERALAATESQSAEAATLARAADQKADAVAGERDEAKILSDLPPLPEREMFGAEQ
jgi:uncharacterized lipoprotein NlpE involved in copper resistance